MHWKEQIDKGVELLELCSTLQSEKDGIERPKLFKIDRTKTLDEDGKIDVLHGDSLSRAALNYILEQNNLKPSK